MTAGRRITVLALIALATLAGCGETAPLPPASQGEAVRFQDPPATGTDAIRNTADYFAQAVSYGCPGDAPGPNCEAHVRDVLRRAAALRRDAAAHHEHDVNRQVVELVDRMDTVAGQGDLDTAAGQSQVMDIAHELVSLLERHVL